MITLKFWNSLSQESREKICKVLGTSGKVTQEYHHNFDYDDLGKKLKNILECCNLQKDGSINIVVNFKPSTEKKKSVPTATKIPCKISEPKKWKFRRYTEDDPDDGEWVWAYGYTEAEARREIEHDYWGTTRLDCHGTFD